jgi:hypothetical protein
MLFIPPGTIFYGIYSTRNNSYDEQILHYIYSIGKNITICISDRKIA